MGVGRSRLHIVKTPLLGFSGGRVIPEGSIQLLLTTGDKQDQVNMMINFLVVDCPVYNTILSRPSLNALQAVVSTYHLAMKFLTNQGVKLVRGDQHDTRQCYTMPLRDSHQTMTIASLDPREDSGERGCPEEDLILIPFDSSYPSRTVQVGSPVTSPLRIKIINLLQQYANVFAWSHEDMPGINPKIIVHRLNVDTDHQPILQKHKPLSLKRYTVIGEKVDNLLKAGFIEEVYYPDCTTNIVLVKKSNGKLRVCVNYTDLNKACTKDSFPFPRID
ncbi:uncharacterized protein LOC131247057 [Magnolia sinica]|uniref:uncharacterized protein LOC131247057 n=1 Tax=Magnolia sinica TaxID=86752 RepID=UPI00265A282E|nr:uncharacterized protein LOC131247057 [Magnolia sinica]